ncbi:MAG TPA: hypothetical protein VHE79_01150 [Spirochaetia bacterium]
MRKSVEWLRRSHEKCARIGIKDSYTEEELDSFGNLASRFARTIDIITSKVLRSIDAMALEGAPELFAMAERIVRYCMRFG